MAGATMNSHELKHAEVRYPETDGKPMAESDLHRDLMLELIARLREELKSLRKTST